jgi:hypothetical protein
VAAQAIREWDQAVAEDAVRQAIARRDTVGYVLDPNARREQFAAGDRIDDAYLRHDLAGLLAAVQHFLSLFPGEGLQQNDKTTKAHSSGFPVVFTDEAGFAWLKVPGAMVQEDALLWPTDEHLVPISPPPVDATPPGAHPYSLRTRRAVPARQPPPGCGAGKGERDGSVRRSIPSPKSSKQYLRGPGQRFGTEAADGPQTLRRSNTQQIAALFSLIRRRRNWHGGNSGDGNRLN